LLRGADDQCDLSVLGTGGLSGLNTPQRPSDVGPLSSVRGWPPATVLEGSSVRQDRIDLWQDIKFGARLLVKARWFTLAAGTALALGIGANTTVFTLVNAVLFRGLPFDEPESIMTVWAENEQNERRNLTHPNYIDLREQSQSLGSLSAVLNSTVNLADDGQPAERIQGAYVSANFFRMLGEQRVLGRNFVDEDDREGVEAAVLLGYSGWQDRYGGDPASLAFRSE
jgi:putative ABC transport system permease protein